MCVSLNDERRAFRSRSQRAGGDGATDREKDHPSSAVGAMNQTDDNDSADEDQHGGRSENCTRFRCVSS